jgi:hypothetical protein
MKTVSPLYIAWAGLSLAAVGLFAEAFRATPRPPREAPSTCRAPAMTPSPAPAPVPARVERTPTTPPLTLPTPPPETGPPSRIRFDKEVLDFGEVWQGTESAGVFRFFNDGEGVLRIHRVNPSCGCTAILTSRNEIPPGEGGEIQVTFKSGSFSGAQQKTINVQSTDSSNRIKVLKVQAMVKPLFVTDPPMLNFGEIDRGREASNVVTIREVQGKPFTIEKVNSTLHFVKGELLPDESGNGAARRFRVTLMPGGNPGSFAGQITLAINRPNVLPILMVQGTISGSLSFFPSSLYLGMVREGQAFQPQTVKVRARGTKPVEVKSVETGVPWIKTELKTVVPGQSYDIHVTVDPQPPPGRFEQAIRITTSDPPPPYQVMVSGVVRKDEAGKTPDAAPPPGPPRPGVTPHAPPFPQLPPLPVLPAPPPAPAPAPATPAIPPRPAAGSTPPAAPPAKAPAPAPANP